VSFGVSVSENDGHSNPPEAESCGTTFQQPKFNEVPKSLQTPCHPVSPPASPSAPHPRKRVT